MSFLLIDGGYRNLKGNYTIDAVNITLSALQTYLLQPGLHQAC